MGNCNSIKAPVVANRCSNYGDRMGSNSNVKGGMILQNFCSLAGVGGNSNRKKWCGRVGDKEWEWKSNSGNNTCTYNSCHPYESQPTGCCGGCCGIIGSGVTCNRKPGTKGFSGSPVPCCLQDYGGCDVFDGTLGPSATQPPPNPGVYSVDKMNLCFSDVKTDSSYPPNINTNRVNKSCYPDANGAQDNCLNTCAPCTRDIISNPDTQVLNNGKLTTCGMLGETTCQKEVESYCTGQDLDIGDTSWIYRWIKPDGTYLPNGCLKVIPRNLFAVSGQVVNCDITTDCTNKNGNTTCTITTTFPDNTTTKTTCNSDKECESQLKQAQTSCYNYGLANGGFQKGGATTQTTCQLTKAYFDILASDNTCTPITFPQSSTGFTYAKDFLEKTLERYTRDGFILGSMPGTATYNPLQEIIYSDICCRFPNLCSAALGKSCANYTAQQLSYNIPASNVCGCYLSNNEYQKYVNEFQVNVECTPLCNRPGVIPLSNPDGSAVRCRQDVCIIDDLAINLTTTNITGDINITQMCANCSDNSSYDSRASASCNCTLDANTINVTGNEIGNININSTCTSTSCSLLNPNTGLTDILPCTQIPKQREIYDQQYQAQQALLKQNRLNRSYVILGIIAAVVILIIILYVLINRSSKNKAANTQDNKGKSVNDSGNRPVEPYPSFDGFRSINQPESFGNFGAYQEGSVSIEGFKTESFRSINI